MIQLTSQVEFISDSFKYGKLFNQPLEDGATLTLCLQNANLLAPGLSQPRLYDIGDGVLQEITKAERTFLCSARFSVKPLNTDAIPKPGLHAAVCADTTLELQYR